MKLVTAEVVIEEEECSAILIDHQLETNAPNVTRNIQLAEAVVKEEYQLFKLDIPLNVRVKFARKLDMESVKKSGSTIQASQAVAADIIAYNTAEMSVTRN
ncbi:hypothetical protein DAPPUDRAFT_253663 [Daphnia pulex]|uniref:Uncharacterized protein n=1 Tax=Daphnia pulex TaxID=6669 RepID=E9H5B4_DAPPU|nr:hypothetical protein DAPPUDRAFT_253663 [Daphnia pulex]|eukprot:EFX73102.1 hypothetical protein DAPPUDRAFT_253663 [Daphnia pulex]